VRTQLLWKTNQVIWKTAQGFCVLEADADAGAGAHGEPSQEWEGFFRHADTSGDGRLSHA
jgi:hypothetical protein